MARDKSFGRASGGISIFVKRNLSFNIKILNNTKLWLFILLENSHQRLVIKCTYWSPKYDTNICIELFEDCLQELLVSHRNDPIIIGGDFMGVLVI